MNFRTTIVLVIVAAVGLAAWMLVTAPRPGVEIDDSNSNEAERGANLVFAEALSDDEIVRVRIERPGQPALAFERDAKSESAALAAATQREWRMTAPVVAGAQTWVVDSLVNQIVDLEAAPLRKGGEAVDGKSAGLDPPTALVTLEDGAGKSYALEIGRKPPLSNDTYVRRPGETQLRVASADLTRDMKKPVADFRARKLLEFKPADVQRVEIAHSDRDYRLVRAGEDWEIKAPVETPADAAKVNGLLSKLSYVSIADFVDDAPPSLATYGFEPPHERIEVTLRSSIPPHTPASSQPASGPTERSEVLLVGGFADAAKAKRFVKIGNQPWVASVNVTDLDPLVPNLTELRDARVTRVTAANARSIEITAAGGASATLRYDGSRWVGEGDLERLDLPAVTELLEAYESLRALEFVSSPGDLSQYGLASPRATITITTADDRRVTLKIGDVTKSGRNAYAQRNDDAEVLVISQQQAADLTVTPLTLRARNVLTVAPGDVREVRIEQGGGEQPGQTTAAARNDAGGWELRQPEGAPLDPAATESLARDLARLRAKRVVGKDSASEYGLSQPSATVHFTVQSRRPIAPASQSSPTGNAPVEPAAPQFEDLPPEKHLLRLAHYNAGYFAQLDSDPYIFELEPSVYRVLTGEMIQRKLFTFAGKDVQRIKVTQRADTIEFERANDEWKYTADPYVKLAKDKVEETATTLAELSAEDFTIWSGGQEGGAGLGEEPVTVEATAGGQTYTLRIARAANFDDLYPAFWVEQGRAFTLRKPEVEKLTRKLDAYLQPVANANANVAPPAAMPDFGLE